MYIARCKYLKEVIVSEKTKQLALFVLCCQDFREQAVIKHAWVVIFIEDKSYKEMNLIDEE